MIAFNDMNLRSLQMHAITCKAAVSVYEKDGKRALMTQVK